MWREPVVKGEWLNAREREREGGNETKVEPVFKLPD